MVYEFWLVGSDDIGVCIHTYPGILETSRKFSKFEKFSNTSKSKIHTFLASLPSTAVVSNCPEERQSKR
jgi:hypothetical protein